MKLPLLDIPADPNTWPDWLDRQLVGSSLGELIEQLPLVVGTPTDALTLNELCGERLTDVYERGTAALRPEQIRSLLRHPELLLDLQELVLTEGGPHWEQLLAASDVSLHIDQHWQTLSGKLFAPAVSLPSTIIVPNPVVSKSPGVGRRVAWALGLAAVVIVAIGLWPKHVDATPRGWNRPDAFTAKLSEDAYFVHLAELAQEWLDAPRETAADLKRHLQDIRRGCDRLLAAPHPQLMEASRNTLYKRCGIWATKLDEQLKALEQPTASVSAVRSATDEIVRNLVDKLEKKLS